MSGEGICWRTIFSRSFCRLKIFPLVIICQGNAGRLTVELRQKHILLPLSILVALHGIGLTTACLSIHKDSSMEAGQHLLNEVVSPGALEDVFLAGVLVEDLVEGVRFHVVHLVGDPDKARYF